MGDRYPNIGTRLLLIRQSLFHVSVLPKTLTVLWLMYCKGLILRKQKQAKVKVRI